MAPSASETSARGPEVRLAELVAALSLGIDLGFGQPMEHVLRQCLIALRMAERVGLGEEQRSVVYYTALLVSVGCHTDAHEQARWFGDDIALKSHKYDATMTGISGTISMFRQLGAGQPPLHRFRLGLEFVLSGYREVADMMSHHAAMARALGEQLALSEATLEALGAAYERYDGEGWPSRLRADAIPIAARIAQLAEYVEVAHRVGGVPAACEIAEARAGTQFDPALTALVRSEGPRLLAGLDDVHAWQAVIAAEPWAEVWISGERLDAALTAIASFVDLKSPWFLGHAQGVADLAGAAANRSGMSAADARQLRHAGLVHGLGRLGISNAILDKPGPLGAGERERVRLQPYLTDRMLRQCETLTPVARIAVQCRERLDGSGYPHGLGGANLSMAARILGAADAYQAMCEPRPHRPARSADEAAAAMHAEVAAGRFDGEAVSAVLEAAGHRVARRREGPAGLTVREIEVLRHLARGLSNKEIANILFISPKTVSNHVEHIYEKIASRSRAAAGLFAMRNGLLPEQGLD